MSVLAFYFGNEKSGKGLCVTPIDNEGDFNFIIDSDDNCVNIYVPTKEVKDLIKFLQIHIDNE